MWLFSASLGPYFYKVVLSASKNKFYLTPWISVLYFQFQFIFSFFVTLRKEIFAALKKNQNLSLFGVELNVETVFFLFSFFIYFYFFVSLQKESTLPF